MQWPQSNTSSQAASSLAFGDSWWCPITLENESRAALEKQQEIADSSEASVPDMDDTTPAESCETNMPNEEEIQTTKNKCMYIYMYIYN